MKPREKAFIVRLELPAGASVRDARTFLTQALIVGRNAQPPHRPFGNLNLDSVKVTLHIPKNRQHP